MPVLWVTFDCYGTLIDWERGITDALLPLLPRGVDRRAGREASAGAWQGGGGSSGYSGLPSSRSPS